MSDVDITASVEFLRDTLDPTDETFDRARRAISELIYSQPSTSGHSLSPLDALRFVASVQLSGRKLPGYATLDASHLQDIERAIDRIKLYIDDPITKRPLNLLLHASPGAGKSHFIKCLASRLDSRNVSPVTYNMAGMQFHADLIPVLDAARNRKVEDRTPMLFLDEFDSAVGNYALLLPLLWDGSLNLGRRDLAVGKAIVVLAGSSPDLPKSMEEARNIQSRAVRRNGPDSKLIDLFSRINGGVITIPPFYDPKDSVDRRPDKVCIAVHLLKQRFGNQLTSVPLALLRFIALATFRYDVRSIAHLINEIPSQGKTKPTVLEFDDLALPLGSADQLSRSSLAYHFTHQDDATGIEEMWLSASKCQELIPIRIDKLDSMASIPAAYAKDFVPDLVKSIVDAGSVS